MSSVSKAALLLGFAGVVALPVSIVATRQPRTRPAVVHLVAPPMTVRKLAADPATLRVCSDPNNLPFSNEHGDGFENAIAELVARDLGKRVSYYWLPQRRGFVRNSLNVGLCDVIMGVPAHYELVRTTRPYYRSVYVFVTPRHRGRALHSLDDPVLRGMTIGIQITGDDYQNPPAAQALASRHLESNVRGYPVYGDYSKPDPQRAIVEDVGAGRIDAAIVWGPLGGYFARQQRKPLTVAAVTPERDAAGGPFAFDIAMGVRHDDESLQQALDTVLARRRAEILRILRRFGVPLAQGEAGS